MGCGELVDQITLYLDGALSRTDRERFEAHCRVCPACRTSLAQTQAVIGSTRRLVDLGEGRKGPARDRILSLFREHGLHRPGPRPCRLPLGLGEAAVAPGDHLAYFWDSDEEFEAAVGFVAAGAGQGETCILLGDDDAHTRLEAGLERASFDIAALRRQGRLYLVSGRRSADALLEEISEQIKAAVDRGEPLVRILGNLGWGHPDWPTDRDLLRLEARVTDTIRNLPTVVMCAYDVRGLPGRNLLLGGLECHPLTFRRDALRPNDHYVPAESFLAALDRDLS
jgi:MEDS: MEthanogen/methylotroph, DcmR Sensory domain/Putative zinc-finger